MDKIKFGLYEKAMPGSLALRQKLDLASAAGFDQLELSETQRKIGAEIQ